MNVILLHSNHQHVITTNVAIFRAMRTRVSNCEVNAVRYNFICILVVIKLKMAT